MRKRRRLCELAACLLLLLASAAQVAPCRGAVVAVAAAGEITGVFYKNDLSEPLPGALVALYRADDNLLADFTYTLDNGRFTLKPQPAEGQFYLVATKDQLSRRVDFQYKPQNPPTNLLIQHPQQRGAFAGWVAYVWKKVDSVVQVLIGILLGLVFKWRDDRKKARKALARGVGFIKVPVDRLLGRYERLRESIEAFSRSSGDSARRRAEYVGAVGEVRETLLELQKDVGARSDLAETLYDVRKEIGFNSYVRFKTSLQAIEEFTNANADAVLTAAPAARAELLKPFEELRESFRELQGQPTLTAR
jgi:hypothetical protein